MKRRENDVTYSGYAGTDAARLPEFEESCRSTFVFFGRPAGTPLRRSLPRSLRSWLQNALYKKLQSYLASCISDLPIFYMEFLFLFSFLILGEEGYEDVGSCEKRKVHS